MPSMAVPRTESRNRTPFAFHDVQVPRGTSATVELPIARLPSGTWADMPVVIAHGRRPGPTVWLSGAIHGDELNGIEITRQLLRKIQPRRLAGTVIAAPIVNVFGITLGSRYLPDRRDLNRSFPGSPRGSLAARLAHVFFSTIASRCEVGLDFHTGSNGRSNLPQLRCDFADPETRALAEVFGAPVVLQAGLRDGSLRAAACRRGSRVLLFEGGEAMRFDPDSISRGVDGALRVLHHLGMIESAPDADGTAIRWCEKSAWMRTNRSGFCHLDTEIGRTVETGEVVATVTDSVSSRVVPLRSRVSGVVVGVLRTGIVHRGDAVVHVAEVAS